MKKSGIELISEERREQIEKHCRTIERDAEENSNFQLSNAAQVLCTVYLFPEDYDIEELCPRDWDLGLFTYMCGKPYKDRLIIAGALIAAEIDRLQYNESKELEG